jgi:diguanylate cyclase (GGDEF)-like protein
VIVELSSMGMYRPTSLGMGDFLGTYGVARDISARKQAEATITFQAYHDLLTGLPNRSLFKDRLGQAMVHAKRHGQTMATLFLDMDHFKVVNDTLGHLVGDGLLQALAQRLRGCLREGDTLSRIGGDEFMVLLPHIRSRDNAAYIAQKIIASLKQPFNIEDNELYASMSIGIAIFPDDGDNIETLIKHADIAMYHAKDHGRNDYKFFTQELHKSFTGRLAIENEMRHALEKKEFEVFYQPQVAVESQRIRGMEALIRWNHPTRGLVSPNDFIPIAEESGLITPISEWVLAAACRQAKLWRDADLPPITMAINLSARQIEHPQFVDKFLHCLHKYMSDGKGIEIEITETTLMRDMDGAIGKLRKLADMGVEISIDDFGTGYSSLSYLKKLPINTIKIDRSFIHDLTGHTSNGSTIVAGIAAMAKGLKLKVVAEGVETQEQLDYLQSLGCDTYQGFFFSRAVNAESATQILTHHPD